MSADEAFERSGMGVSGIGDRLKEKSDNESLDPSYNPEAAAKRKEMLRSIGWSDLLVEH